MKVEKLVTPPPPPSVQLTLDSAEVGILEEILYQSENYELWRALVDVIGRKERD